MSVQLNHTIVHSSDKRASAEFLARIMGLEVGPPYGPFLPVQTSNAVTLDYADSLTETIIPQHYAFLVSEREFDEIFGRVRAAGLPYWAGPLHHGPGEINHNDGGRGVYFDDPDGHALEIITRPYGSGG
ncbi:chaP protein [Sphaerisporangium krabiense]|uniref:Catechol 2,3-dioxygenase-like lactoylglutathione lyase family enzyme n=1 Tax=Sphaerisporangium krabiense TaxID=763782 RepID=A0A7W9DU70_9ACTN|nr:VOC family protein [Sphaerisporangium krabiense]MBB5631401.1 catechol 2,3-dioxygenase-like lactoylglutathione lyase family enzyme [Sphaerisporangium krabiense]GII60819.1 chaP protein [Sphaerisporangium krabiense]